MLYTRKSQGVPAGAAKESGATAAHSDETAHHLAAALPRRLKQITLPFSAALVASMQNRHFWPPCSDNALQSLLSPASAFITSYEGTVTPAMLHDISLPGDQLPALVDYVVRHEARCRGEHAALTIQNLRLLPPTEHLASLEEIANTLLLSASLLQTLRSLDVRHAMLAATPRSLRLLTSLLKQTSQLRCLSLVQCGLREATGVLCRALRDSATLAELSLEGNDVGLCFDGEDGEVGAALCELLRLNKFLLALDLSYNNCGTSAVVRLMRALADSDTQLRPTDLPAEPVVSDVPITTLVNSDLFVGELSDNDAEDEASEAEEAEEEDGMRHDDGDSDAEQDAVQREEADEEEAGEEEADEEKGPEATDEDDAVEDGEKSVDDGAEEEYRHRRWLKLTARRQAKEQRQVVREERGARHTLLVSYVQETTTKVAVVLSAIRARRRDEKRAATEAFCKRRSGWSHLQRLCLRGNCVKDRGAQAIAMVLRSEVPMTEEDTRRVQHTTRQALRKLIMTLLAARYGTRTEEQAAWRAIGEAAAADFAEVLRAHGTRQGRTEEDAVPPFPTVTAMSSVEGDDGDAGRGAAESDDEEATADEDGEDYMAPAIVMTNVDQPVEGMMGGDDDAAAVMTMQQECAALGLNPGTYAVSAEDEGAAEQSSEENEAETDNDDDDVGEGVAGTAWDIPVPAVKPGMSSLTYLDIGSCQISSRGLKSMAAVLEGNTTLRTLLLRNNPLAMNDTRAALKADAGVGLANRAESGDEVAPGFAALADMLRRNTVLEHLNLGFCQLTSVMLRLLAAALLANKSLKILILDGNRFCDDKSAMSCKSAHDMDESALQVLLGATVGGALRQLDLSSNDIGNVLWHGEVQALADASTSLTALHLSHAALRGEHVGQWAAALQDRACTLTHLDLGRNAFAGETDGAALGSLLSHCTQLTELTLDGNPRLTSRGLAAALDAAALTTTLRSLSCSGVATTAVEAAVAKATISSSILATLHSLNLADVDVQSESELVQWLQCCQEHAPRLRFLVLWTRRLNMAGCLPKLWSIARTMPSLLFVDFGTLLHCDGMPDPDDTLHVMEQELVRRRMAAIDQSSIQSKGV